MEHFYHKLAEILETDKINQDSVLSEFDAWDSLGVLSVIALIDSEYNITLTAEEISGMKNAGELESFIKSKL